jgi:methyl-accepting chemotaxis protein
VNLAWRGPRAWLADRPVAGKLALIAAVFAATAVAVAAVGLQRLNTVDAGTRAVHRGQLQMQQLSGALANVIAVRADLRDHILATDTAGLAKFADAIKGDDAAITKALSEFERSGLDGTDRSLLARFRDQFGRYEQIRDMRVLPASAIGHKTEAYQILTTEAVPPYRRALTALNQMSAHQVALGKASMAASDRNYRNALWTVAAILVVALTLGMLLTTLVLRMITRPVRQVAEVLAEMADGNLSARVAVSSRDEIGRMASAAARASEHILMISCIRFSMRSRSSGWNGLGTSKS